MLKQNMNRGMSFEELRRLRSGPAKTDDKRGGLFETDWEVLVIKHDKVSGAYKWFTECCERIAAIVANEKQHTKAPCC